VRSRGFTLLEVMVAVAILATALSAIFSSQAGLIAATNEAKRLSIATSLARCRMTEIEDRLRTDGFPLDDEDEEADECCEDPDGDSSSSYESFRCHWRIESVELPSVEAIETAAGEALSQTDAIPGAGVVGQDPAEQAEAAGDQATAMMGGEIAALYPLVSEVLKASIRRVTVEVIWQEGQEEEKVDAVQYVTMPTQGQQAAQALPTGPDEGPPTDNPAEPGAGTAAGTRVTP
jgi:general secretion pathway protein I